MITPLALLGAGLLFLIVSGYGRWWVSPTVGSSSRYVHLAAAFSLPAIAVAVDALARGRRYGNIVAAVLLACLIPYGVSQFDTNPPFTSAYFKGRETLIAALGRSPYLTQVPRSTRIDSPWSTITAGWLLDARNGGDLPPLHQPAAVRDPSLALRFGFAQLDRPVGARTCTSVPRFIDVSLHRGDEIGIKVAKGNPSDGPTFFGQQITAQLLRNGLPAGLPVIYVTSTGHVFRAELGAMDVRLRPGLGTRSFAVCR
jgi:hypothetical protein